MPSDIFLLYHSKCLGTVAIAVSLPGGAGMTGN